MRTVFVIAVLVTATSAYAGTPECDNAIAVANNTAIVLMHEIDLIKKFDSDHHAEQVAGHLTRSDATELVRRMTFVITSGNITMDFIQSIIDNGCSSPTSEAEWRKFSGFLSKQLPTIDAERAKIQSQYDISGLKRD
jgi:hypothetical protein